MEEGGFISNGKKNFKEGMTVIRSFKEGLFLTLILAVALVLMLNAAFGDAAIFDETAHIGAGYSYVKYLDYRLNPEHPPLLKALAALPLLFQKINFPLNAQSWQNEVNGQWDIGGKLLYESGNDADKIIHWVRITPIIFTLLLIVLVYFWSKELLGRRWAFLPTILVAFSPTILAHGHYLTTDVAASLGISAATYFFLKFLLHPSGKNLLAAGLIFGLAQLMKFSVLILIPFFIIIFLVFYFSQVFKKESTAGKQGGYYWRSLIAIFLIGLVVIYLVYFLFTANYPAAKQLTDAQTILHSFTPKFLAQVDFQLIQNSISRPLGQYLFGVLMILQRAAGGNNAYFMGEVSSHGRFSYFPTLYLLKEPLPVLILLIVVLLSAGWRIIKKANFPKFDFRSRFLDFKNYLGTRLPEFSMLVFIFLYLIYSFNSNLNIGLRHLLPTFPFIYILIVSGLKTWVHNSFEKSNFSGIFVRIFQKIKQFFKVFFKLGFIFVLLLWYVLETLLVSPYFLSYFNEIKGGTFEGYRYVTDSNYDWGQDLKRLKNFVEEKKIDKIAVDYFGGGKPEYYLGDRAEPWWSARGNPKDTGINWLAISANTLEGALAKLAPDLSRKPEDEYQWLQKLRPMPEGLGQVPQFDFRVGTSIFVYHL